MEPISSITYTIPYFFVFLILLWIYYLESTCRIKKQVAYKTCIGIFICFFCLRSFVGWDWMSYYPMFKAIDNLFDFTSESFIIVYGNNLESDIIEPGFIIYTSIIKTIFDNWNFFVFISTLIPIIAIAVFVKKYSTDYALSFTLFFALYSCLLIDLMRNSLSLSIFFFSLVIAGRHRFLLLLLLSLIGISIHRTYIFLFPLYFIQYFKFSKKTIWIIFLISNMIMLLQIPIIIPLMYAMQPIAGDVINEKISNYLNKDHSVGPRGITLGYFIRIGVFFVVMHYCDKIYSYKKYILILNAYFLYVFMSIGLSDMRAFADRIEYVYCFPFLILYPLLLHIPKPIFAKRFIIFLVLFSFLKIYSYTSSIMLEYRTIFSDATFDRQYTIKRPIAEKIIENE